jgi:hypothetical protein
MNDATHPEHRAGSSRGKHEGESSLGLCDRFDRTRDNSQRQLPTDHDYAVPTREYEMYGPLSDVKRPVRQKTHFPPALCSTRAGGEGYRRDALRPDTYRTPESAAPVKPLPKAAAQRRGATRSSQSEHGERG